MRLIDSLRTQSFAADQQLDETVPFVIDNVADYLLGDRAMLDHYSEGGDARAFPSVVPVFDNMFMEYREHGRQAADIEFAGVQLLSGSAYETWLSRLIEPNRRSALAGQPAGAFTYAALLYLKQFRGVPGKSMVAWLIAADEDGIMCGSQTFTSERVFEGMSEEAAENLSRWCNRTLMSAFLALSFLSCKNVKRELSPEETLSRQQRRWHERHPEATVPLPAVRYYTLQIEPMKSVLANEGAIAHNGLKKAMHICRGFFATYTEERPLFGKYVGRFRIPAHVRGDPSRGMVGKSYEVKPPRPQK